MNEPEESTGAQVTRTARRLLAGELEKARRFAGGTPPDAKLPSATLAALAFALAVVAFAGGVVWDAGEAGEKLSSLVAGQAEMKEGLAELRGAQQTQGEKVIRLEGANDHLRGDLSDLKEELRSINAYLYNVGLRFNTIRTNQRVLLDRTGVKGDPLKPLPARGE